MSATTRSGAPDWSRVIDPRTGLITQLEQYANPPEWPHRFAMTVGHVADTNADGTWPSDRMSTGMGFGDPGAIADAAIGEALERYCGNFVPEGLPLASHRELGRRGVAAIDPSALRLFSPEQYVADGFWFEPLTHDLPVRWVQGRTLTANPAHSRTMLAPASLVLANFHATRYAGEPRTNPVLFAGLAAGASRRDAELAAMAEIIERDAVELWWRAGAPAIGVEPALLGDFWRNQRSTTDQFEYTVLAVPHRWGVPVIAVVLFDPEYQLLTVGTACRPTVAAAAAKAAAEALSLRSYSKGLLDPEGGAWQAVRLGLFADDRLKPFRADRRYRDSYASDFSDLTDLCCNSQYYLDERARAAVEHLRHPEGLWGADRLPDLVGDPHLHHRTRLAELGQPPVSVDLTTPDVASIGVSVVRVVAPGTYSNAVAAHPLRGGDRWRTEPIELGLVDAPLPHDLPIRPLPHT